MSYIEPDTPWPFLPNWSQSYRETWEFKTDVFVSRSGKEQRRALRNTPRKSIEYTSVLKASALRMFNAYMAQNHAAITAAADLPRYQLLTAACASTDLTATIDVVAPWVRAGDIVILMDGETIDIRKIQSVSGHMITFTAVGQSNFPSGARIHPAIPAFLSDQISVPRLTNTVAQAAIKLDSAPGYVPLVEPAPVLRNLVRNGQARGAAAVDSLPTNWAVAFTAGLTAEVVGRGYENGVGYVDIHLSGTTTSTAWRLRTDSQTQAAAASGDEFTAGGFVSLVGGSLANITDVQVRVEERDSAGSLLANSSASVLPIESRLKRQTVNRTLTNGSTAHATMGFALTFASGAAVEVTLRFGGASLEKSAVSPVYLPTPATAGGRSGVFDGRELFLLKPNWSQAVDLSYEVATDTVDYARGRIKRYNPIPFATRMHQATYLRRNQDDASVITDLFMRSKGRRGEFYMPTWEPDLVALTGATAGGTTITVSGTDGYDLFQNSPVHRAIIVVLKDGNLYPKTLSSVSLSGGNSIINTVQAWEDSIDAADIAMICWLPLCRFASDGLTLEWLTMSVMQTQLSIQTLEWVGAE